MGALIPISSPMQDCLAHNWGTNKLQPRAKANVSCVTMSFINMEVMKIVSVDALKVVIGRDYLTLSGLTQNPWWQTLQSEDNIRHKN